MRYRLIARGDFGLFVSLGKKVFFSPGLVAVREAFKVIEMFLVLNMHMSYIPLSLQIVFWPKVFLW